MGIFIDKILKPIFLSQESNWLFLQQIQGGRQNACIETAEPESADALAIETMKSLILRLNAHLFATAAAGLITGLDATTTATY